MGTLDDNTSFDESDQIDRWETIKREFPKVLMYVPLHRSFNKLRSVSEYSAASNIAEGVAQISVTAGHYLLVSHALDLAGKWPDALPALSQLVEGDLSEQDLVGKAIVTFWALLGAAVSYTLIPITAKVAADLGYKRSTQAQE